MKFDQTLFRHHFLGEISHPLTKIRFFFSIIIYVQRQLPELNFHFANSKSMAKREFYSCQQNERGKDTYSRGPFNLYRNRQDYTNPEEKKELLHILTEKKTKKST